MRKILFVCSGNTCRSPMAEGLLRDMLERVGRTDVTVLSAGTGAIPGAPPARSAVEVLAEVGIDISGHKARRLSDESGDFDILIAMTEAHKEFAEAVFPGREEDIFLIKPGGIMDPFGGTIKLYRQVRDEIKEVLGAIAEMLT